MNISDDSQNDEIAELVTNYDVKEAQKLLPNVPAYNFDLAKDYSILKNAHYLLLANSSFAYFPAFTSDTVKTIIAPKYWARHNVSDGYWASEQNIYEGWTYQDREGRLFSAEQCREELAHYKEESATYRRLNCPMSEQERQQAYKKAERYYQKFHRQRLWNGAKRKLRMLFKHE